MGTPPIPGDHSLCGEPTHLGDPPYQGDPSVPGDPSLPWGPPPCHGDLFLPQGSPRTSGTVPATEIPPGPLWHSPAGVSARFPPNSPIFFSALPGRREAPAPSDGARSCSAGGRAFLPQIMTRDPRYRRCSRCSRCSRHSGVPGALGAPGVPGTPVPRVSSVPPGTPGALGRYNRAGRWRRSGLGLDWGWAAGP